METYTYFKYQQPSNQQSQKSDDKFGELYWYWEKKTPYDADNFTHQWMYYNYFTYRVQNIVI